jgi:uncharacterized membrane protein
MATLVPALTGLTAGILIGIYERMRHRLWRA